MNIFILTANFNDPELIAATQTMIDNSHKLVADYRIADLIIIADDLQKAKVVQINKMYSPKSFVSWPNFTANYFLS